MSTEVGVKASLRYLASQLSKDEKTLDQATERLMEIIDKKFNEKYDSFFKEEVNEKRKELEQQYQEQKELRLQNDKKSLEDAKSEFDKKLKVLAEREKEVEIMRLNLLQQDPKFFAAKHACDIAAEAAGIDIETDIDKEHFSEFTEAKHPNLYGGERYLYSRKSKEKNVKYAAASEYTKQQLVRTIGIIWAAAFGMQSIGSSMTDDAKKKPAEEK